jgi:tyrosine-protein phosphatase SIW14
MSRTWLYLLGVLVVAALVVGPLAFAFQVQNELRGLKVVREGVLYRSGQMTTGGLKRALHDHGIRTVVSLRDAPVPEKLAPDLDEEAWCARMGVKFHRLPPQPWEARVGPPPVEPNVRKFRAILADPENHPVLVHCFAGIHRTGAYCAIYRMEFEGWTNEQANAEVMACGYGNFYDDLDISGYLDSYRPSWQTVTEETPQVHEVKKPRVRSPRKKTSIDR